MIQAARAQGVKRIVTVCPGCELRLAPAATDNAPEIEFVSFARLLVDAGVRVQAEALKGCALPVSVVDSCQDRAGAHGPAIRQLFQDADAVPFPATGKDAWCCGASGSVNSIDPRFVRECTRHQMARGAQAGARTLITACPTCAYTYAFERWTRAAEGSADITIGTAREGGHALVWVEDNGQGVPPGDEDKVFDMFYTGVKRSPDSRRGIGLGLALCRSIVQAHGGEISMKNIKPHGARFWFTLPLAEVKEYEY